MIPVESPTVPKADIISKSNDNGGNLLCSTTNIIIKAISIRDSAIIRITMALIIIICGIVFEKASTLFFPLSSYFNVKKRVEMEVVFIPPAVDLITDMEKSISNDGKLSRKEQSRLMTKFHALIKEIKTQRKSGDKAA